MNRLTRLAVKDLTAGKGVRVQKAFPVSASSFPSPKSGATPLPASKVVGNPNDVLIASRTYPPASVVSPYRPFPLVRPEPAFARSLEGLPVVSAKQSPARLEMRRVLEQRDRVIRANAGRRLVLNMQTRTGMDWIKYDRRIKPRVAGHVDGLIAATAVAGVRGTSADALRVPAGTVQSLAAKGIASDAVPPASVVALSTPVKPLPAPEPEGNTIARAETMPNANLSLIVVALVVGGMLFFMFTRTRR